MADPSDPNKELIDLGPQYQEMNPELGPLSRRVETTFLEGIYSEKVNLEETDYWFTEPEGGWTSENVVGIRARKEATDEISAIHFGPGRTELHELKEGEVMAGIVSSLMYNHGVQVDLGAQHDGLIPVRGEEWVEDHFRSKYGVSLGVSELFYIGQAVKVRIHRINLRPRCRFPIQLEVLFPDVQHKLSNPDDFVFPFDLRGVKSREEAFAITGRPHLLEPTREAFIDHQEIRDLELTQRVPELSAAAYGQKDIAFEDIDIWDKDIMDILDSQNLEHLEDEQEDLGLVDDSEIYEEAL